MPACTNAASPVRSACDRHAILYRATASDIIHDKSLITEQLVDEWHEAVQDREYVRFLLRVSRATRDRSVEEELGSLRLPTLIIWGRSRKMASSVGRQ